jgi:hypothetical protein
MNMNPNQIWEVFLSKGPPAGSHPVLGETGPQTHSVYLSRVFILASPVQRGLPTVLHAQPISLLQ